MATRTLSTLEVMTLIDNLQAVQPNMDDACNRLGLTQPTDLGEAMRMVEPILRATTSAIVKLQAQFEDKFTPAVAVAVVNGQLHTAKYKNEVASFDLADDEWDTVDQWRGLYSMVPHCPDFLTSMIV